MAVLSEKIADNATGEFYVDKMCIDCDVCRDTAPANFTRNDDKAYSFVYKQPVSPDELDLCEEAMMACPVDAIGNDGI